MEIHEAYLKRLRFDLDGLLNNADYLLKQYTSLIDKTPATISDKTYKLQISQSLSEYEGYHFEKTISEQKMITTDTNDNKLLTNANAILEKQCALVSDWIYKYEALINTIDITLKQKERIFKSESGIFICDEHFILTQFIPTQENILGKNTIKHMIIPEGITGFCRDFGSRITVTEQFTLPETLLEIGNSDEEDWQKSRMNVFACAKLPVVIIPESVKYIGLFAFGSSNIATLCLPAKYHEKLYPHVRQFKDAKINTLYVHEDNYKDSYNYFYSYNAVYYYQTRETGRLPEKVFL